MLNSRIEIKLMSDKNKYDFYQNRSSYQKNDFYKSAKEGDSIFKNAYSDTVLIKGSDQMKSYIIEHP